MKIYTVHINPKEKNPLESLVLVREGFSLPAFFLTFFWAFYHRSWLLAVVLLVASAMVPALQKAHIVGMETAWIINAAIMLLTGLEAHDCYRSSLARRGFEMIGQTGAKNEAEAQQRFLEHYLAGAA